MWTPFAIDAKGGEMKTKGEMQTKRGACSQGEHELLSSMTKGEIVDKIVIDATTLLKMLKTQLMMQKTQEMDIEAKGC